MLSTKAFAELLMLSASIVFELMSLGFESISPGRHFLCKSVDETLPLLGKMFARFRHILVTYQGVGGCSFQLLMNPGAGLTQPQGT